MFASVLGRAAAVAFVVLALAVPSAAAAQPPDMQLETGPNNRTLRLGDIASANQIAVVFQNTNKSYLRWSADGGTTFTPRHVLRDGLRAKNPRVDACADMVWIASEWQSDVTQKVGVDYFDTNLSTTGRFSLGAGTHPDVACFGNVVAVTWWLDDHNFLAMSDGPCGNPCVPALKYDLGPSDFDNPARIAADGNGFAVSWIRDPDQITEALNVQHFQVYTSGGLNVLADPIVSMLVNKDFFSPVIAGDGSRVVVAYSRRGQTHMRISDDHGANFGPRIIVSNFCRDCPEGGSQPMGIDARDGDILVEVLRAGGLPPDFDARGFLTHNDGNRWLKTPSNRGQKFGVLLGDTLAEVWDDSLARGFPYPSRPQVIMFHIRNI